MYSAGTITVTDTDVLNAVCMFPELCRILLVDDVYFLGMLTALGVYHLDDVDVHVLWWFRVVTWGLWSGLQVEAATNSAVYDSGERE